jgi:hypothetical protein
VLSGLVGLPDDGSLHNTTVGQLGVVPSREKRRTLFGCLYAHRSTQLYETFKPPSGNHWTSPAVNEPAWTVVYGRCLRTEEGRSACVAAVSPSFWPEEPRTRKYAPVQVLLGHLFPSLLPRERASVSSCVSEPVALSPQCPPAPSSASRASRGGVHPVPLCA